MQVAIARYFSSDPAAKPYLLDEIVIRCKKMSHITNWYVQTFRVVGYWRNRFKIWKAVHNKQDNGNYETAFVA